MADRASQHIFLAESLRAVLLSPVVIVMMNNASAGAMTQFWGGNRRPFQIAHEVIDVLAGMFRLLNDVYFPETLKQHLKATRAAAFAVTPLTDVFGVRTVNRSATLPGNAHGTGLAGEHPLNDPFGLLADDIAVFSASLAPAIILSRFEWEWGFANAKKRQIGLKIVS